MQSDRTVLQQIDDALKGNEIDLPRFRLCFMAELSEEARFAMRRIMMRQEKEGFGRIKIKKMSVHSKVLDYYDCRAVLQFFIDSFNQESKKKLFKPFL